MRSFIIACIVTLCVAAPAWSHMDQQTACIDHKTSLTCAYPSGTTYDKAFSMAASLAACPNGVAVSTENRATYDCYDENTCRFCFDHADEYFSLEAAMGASVPACTADSNMICPKHADIQKWDQNHLLTKVHTFWGSRELPLPAEITDPAADRATRWNSPNSELN